MAELEKDEETGEERTHIHFQARCSNCASIFTTCAFVYGRGNVASPGLPLYYMDEPHRSVDCPFCGQERCAEIEEFPIDASPGFVVALAGMLAIDKLAHSDDNPKRGLN